jgi:hypothetical protein
MDAYDLMQALWRGAYLRTVLGAWQLSEFGRNWGRIVTVPHHEVSFLRGYGLIEIAETGKAFSLSLAGPPMPEKVASLRLTKEQFYLRYALPHTSVVEDS